jgi:hypothetical protein
VAKQPADLHSLETALFRAREFPDELDEGVILYFIDMAIAEAKNKSPLTADDHKSRTRGKSRVSPKSRSGSGVGLPFSSALASAKLNRPQVES